MIQSVVCSNLWLQSLCGGGGLDVAMNLYREAQLPRGTMPWGTMPWAVSTCENGSSQAVSRTEAGPLARLPYQGTQGTRHTAALIKA